MANPYRLLLANWAQIGQKSREQSTKGLELGVRAALNRACLVPENLKVITAAAESWLVSEACRKPVEVGYS